MCRRILPQKTAKIHTSGRISLMNLVEFPMMFVVWIQSLDYNTLKWDGVNDPNGSIEWGSGSTGDGFTLSGGTSSSTPSLDTTNIAFERDVGLIFGSSNHRNIFIGHNVGSGCHKCGLSSGADDNIILGHGSFKQSDLAKPKFNI